MPLAAQPPEAWQAPTLTITRYDEDQSILADETLRNAHWTGKFKYIPLTDTSWLSTGLELRLRNEDFTNNLWGDAPAPDDSYLWARALPYADLHIGDVRLFVQPIAAYAIGVAPAASPIDGTRLDLLQGFAEFRQGLLTIRAGRQMLPLGTERLVGTRYGPNVPRAFDGARAIFSGGQANVSLIAVRPVEPGADELDDRRSHNQALWGIYAELAELDAYYLGYRNRAGIFSGATAGETRHSLGLRSYGERGDFRWNIEGVYQFGQFGNQRIRAWTLATEVGRSFPDMPLTPDATLRFNIVSGDSNASDKRLGTFNALFPTGKYFGELSPVGPTNLVNIYSRLSINLSPDVSASIAGSAYWRYARTDGVYDIPGNLIRAPGDSRERFIGTEAEATLAWQVTPELELSASYSFFEPGRFIRETGPARRIQMISFESNFRF